MVRPGSDRDWLAPAIVRPDADRAQAVRWRPPEWSDQACGVGEGMRTAMFQDWFDFSFVSIINDLADEPLLVEEFD